MPVTIVRVSTQDGTAIPNGGSTSSKDLKVSGKAVLADQAIQITNNGIQVGYTTAQTDTTYMADVSGLAPGLYNFVASTRGGQEPSDVWKVTVED
ncbi:hypothetical protein [Pseudomonas sp. W4I3]|uniref:hypothetical protein n=1 Tax=Pseudomonas sp. W4I3 TaxID=3042294 RepID=UPI0027804567|nr:hypothetical protein [Pseudomonas sp. W4I3]MDQ0742214.1 hypothetical protein [Pseudomonas sp. W4I3]